MQSYAIQLAQDLVRCPSVTPAEGGALDLMQDKLCKLGFNCTRLPFGKGVARIDNLFARRGTSGPHFAFAGHTDVVPVGDPKKWQYDPFSGVLRDGKLFGRGAADMKGGVAAFVAAVAEFIQHTPDAGSISLIITGDEEADADFGTVKMIEWMEVNEHVPDVCVVGEPTNPNQIGDVIKNGRRGSLSCHLQVDGKQGHVAYPHLAKSPVPALFEMLAMVNATELDDGTEEFVPSTAQIVDLVIENPASNVIPEQATGQFNIRFNTIHSVDSLKTMLTAHFDQIAARQDVRYDISFASNASPFVTPSGALTKMMAEVIRTHTGRTPDLSTTGGTSDARFICQLCDVAEFGLVGKTMHKIDEHVEIDDIDRLAAIYCDMLVAARV